MDIIFSLQPPRRERNQWPKYSRLRVGSKISGVGTWSTNLSGDGAAGIGRRKGRKGGSAFVDTKRARRSPLTLTLNFSSFPLPSFNLISKSLRASNRVAPARAGCPSFKTSLGKGRCRVARGESEACELVWSRGVKARFQIRN